MDASGWQDGLLLIHIHEKWRAADMAQLECLANGANGIWAALSEDGAALGHASTTLTLMNLIRLGNTKVTEKFNCQKLRESASKVCQISTGSPPNPKMPVYGERALDLVFPFGSIAGGLDDQGELNLSQFFGQVQPMRISEFASEEMILIQLENTFGKNDYFDETIVKRMKRTVMNDFKQNRKEDYMSKEGMYCMK